MIRRIQHHMPRSLRDILGPLYSGWRYLRPDPLRGRNWKLNISVPRKCRDEFLRSVTMGTVDFPVKNDRTNVLLCAQPKSASLYIVQLLSLCLEFKNHQIGFNKVGGGIYYPRLLAVKFTDANTISHCHAEPTPPVLKMIKSLDLRVLVLTRNILDALVSRRDMLLRDGWASNILSKKAVNDFIAGAQEYQMDVIIDLFASSYINFYAGWDQYRNDSAIKPIYLTYQELIDDEIGLVQRVAAELNQSISRKTIEKVSSKIAGAGGINFFTGVVGRGRDMFSERQLSILKQKARLLGCNDEAFLGFGA